MTLCLRKGHAIPARGTRQSANRRTLLHLLERKVRTCDSWSVVLAQIHAGVETGDLVVSVEHQRLMRFEKLRQAPLTRLAPARMIHIRIHVGVETVFARAVQVPRCWRLIFDESDFHDRLDALEA